MPYNKIHGFQSTSTILFNLIKYKEAGRAEEAGRTHRVRRAAGAVAAPSIWAALNGIEKVCRHLNKIKII
jgi:hypothetical protein